MRCDGYRYGLSQACGYHLELNCVLVNSLIQRLYLCAGESPYVLHPISVVCPKMVTILVWSTALFSCPFISSKEDKHFSRFMPLLLAVDVIITSLVLCAQWNVTLLNAWDFLSHLRWWLLYLPVWEHSAGCKRSTFLQACGCEASEWLVNIKIP